MEHPTHQTARTLPLEVVEYIIESVDDQALAPTLFPLLTVSKSMFSLAVRRLYANPIKSLTSCCHPAAALYRMLALIAQICPEVDPALLQKYLLLTSQCLPSNTPTGPPSTHMTTPCDQPPYADYFSFVRALDCDYEFGTKIRQTALVEASAAAAAAGFASAPLGEELNDMQAPDTPLTLELESTELLPIFWMACGTCHLGKLRRISIHPAQLHEYHHMLEHVTGIDAINCYFDGGGADYYSGSDDADYHSDSVSDDVDCIRYQLSKVTKAVLYLVGSLQGCPQRKPIHLRLHIAYDDQQSWYHFSLYKPIRKLFTILSGNSTVRVEDICTEESTGCNSNWVRFYVMPESIDLANVRSICQFSLDPIYYDILPWPKGGKGAILRQCRRLRELKIYVAQEDEQEEVPTLFAWAREERQQMLSKASKDSGYAHKGILANTAGSSMNHSHGPVPLETLCLAAPWGVTMERSVQDALFAFGPTLQYILLDDKSEIDLAWFQYLPVLRELDIRSSSIQYSTWSSGVGAAADSNEIFPRLESIALKEYENGTSEPQETWETLVWPHMQRLSRITLIGLVVHRVPQAVLADHSSQLQELTILSEDWVFKPLCRTYVWDMACWQQMTKLQVLRLRGPMVTTFRRSMLATCPDLWRLELAADLRWRSVHGQMRLDQYFDNEHLDGDTGVDQAALNVRQLHLSGWAVSATVVEQVLPSMFPALERLKVFNCYPDPISEEQRERIYAQLPKLKEIEWISPWGWKCVIRR